MNRRSFFRGLATAIAAPFALLPRINGILQKPIAKIPKQAGFYGINFLEAGAFYAPYIPIYKTPTFKDYSSTNIKPEYYKKITIDL